MTKYEKQILNVLLDKYEGSKSFIGTNQVNQSFTCKVAQMFPKYKDDSEYEHDQCDNRLGFEESAQRRFPVGIVRCACFFP